MKLGSKIWGRCTYCNHETWVWVLNAEEMFCDTHVSIAEELDKRLQDDLETERA